MARPNAFDILYREYYVRVFGLCRRLLNSSERAEDAAQETFIRAYKRFHKFDASQPFWAWIATIASNHCIDLLRQRHRTDALFSPDDTDLDSIAGGDPSPADQLMAHQDAVAVNAAIAQLPDKYRVPLVLACFHGASYERVAEHLGVTANHVGVLLLRARQRLRTLLADEHGGATT